jgi:tRNA pseudouridine38-40 synthase
VFPHYAIVQYDGSDFVGWQRQTIDRSVQGELEKGLTRINGETVDAHGAGRTDAGVHALGQVASFDLKRAWGREELTRAINGNTPRDMWIRTAATAPENFHARKSATARRYRYVVGCDAGAVSPFRRPFEWALGQPLDGDLLQAAADAIQGEHDFTALSAVGQEKPHYRCRITTAEWTERQNQEGFTFTVEADRFLHRMVRFLVGVMVDVGRARRPLEDITHLLQSDTNREASKPAPPEGLYFVAAHYPDLPGGQS